jgi:hypothetical protein
MDGEKWVVVLMNVYKKNVVFHMRGKIRKGKEKK